MYGKIFHQFHSSGILRPLPRVFLFSSSRVEWSYGRCNNRYGHADRLGTESFEVFDRLCSGENAVTKIDGFDCRIKPVQFAGEIKDFDPMPVMKNFKKVRQTARSHTIWLQAYATVERAGLIKLDGSKDRVGTFGPGMEASMFLRKRY